MKLLNYLGMVIVITVLGILYKRYQKKYEPDYELKQYDLVKKYLLNDEMIHGRPNLWIHINYQRNGRNWESFNSRLSDDLNKPYVEMCVESIIKYNDNYFNIFIINDESFGKLLSDWDIDMNNVPEPIKSKARQYGLCKLLYHYGGINVPSSFVCTKSLLPFFNTGVMKSKMFCVETLNKTVNYNEKQFVCDGIMMGCIKYNKSIGELCKYMNEMLNVEDQKTVINGNNCGLWLEERKNTFDVNVMDGKLIGVKDEEGEPIELDDLLGATPIKYNFNKYGVLIDEKMLDKRLKYEWFNRLSKEQIFESNTEIGKVFLLSHGEGVVREL